MFDGGALFGFLMKFKSFRNLFEYHVAPWLNIAIVFGLIVTYQHLPPVADILAPPAGQGSGAGSLMPTLCTPWRTTVTSKRQQVKSPPVLVL